MEAVADEDGVVKLGKHEWCCRVCKEFFDNLFAVKKHKNSAVHAATIHQAKKRERAETAVEKHKNSAVHAATLHQAEKKERAETEAVTDEDGVSRLGTHHEWHCRVCKEFFSSLIAVEKHKNSAVHAATLHQAKKRERAGAAVEKHINSAVYAATLHQAEKRERAGMQHPEEQQMQHDELMNELDESDDELDALLTSNTLIAECDDEDVLLTDNSTKEFQDMVVTSSSNDVDSPEVKSIVDIRATRTLHVKGLNPETTKETLQGAFDGSTAARIALTRNGNSRCFGFVDFEDGASAEEAIKTYQCMELDGNELTLEFSGRPPEVKTIYVRGLNHDTKVATLQAAFEGCMEARIPRKRDGCSKGYGFVDFEDKSSFEEAFERNQRIKLDGKILHLQISEKNKGRKHQGRGRARARGRSHGAERSGRSRGGQWDGRGGGSGRNSGEAQVL